MDTRLTLPDYENVAFKRLSEICPDSIIELMNDLAVRRHLPLARGHFGVSACESFVALKERMWEDRGFGPWAFVLDEEFIGWGGLQPEGDDVDVGLVLSRKHWGAGPVLSRMILIFAFEELGVDSVIALLPPSRKRVAALRRFGFREDGEIVTEDRRFVRYRLMRTDWRRTAASGVDRDRRGGRGAAGDFGDRDTGSSSFRRDRDPRNPAAPAAGSLRRAPAP